MGTKRPRDDPTPDDRTTRGWRTLALGVASLIDRIRSVSTGVIILRLRYARTRGLLPTIVATIHSTELQLPRPL